ncbi:hypothetical protein [Cellulomonas sp. ATA003]|uniref:hypothetical protein n=1 Tax=Cellulomonas sp. ATA003 TaxID=3073064 RepID=UPI002873C714|nr:hypothetical protein [Cellulomonas sp. ATA003]WNB84703.1 hypothetical protein REH70_13080 [Cellulomonas sp. ATA003]
MEPLDEAATITVTRGELMMLRAGLKAYLTTFGRHREEDGGASHAGAEWLELQRRTGELIWRLEEAGAPPGARIIHSPEAVKPGSRGRRRRTEAVIGYVGKAAKLV